MNRFTPDALPVPDGIESPDPTSRLASLRERVDQTDPRAVAERTIKAIHENPNMSNSEAVRLLRQAADLLAGITDRATGSRRFYALQSEGRILDRLDTRNRLSLSRFETRGRVPVGLPLAPPTRPGGFATLRPVPGPFIEPPPTIGPQMFVREGPNRISFSGQRSAEYTATFHALTDCGQPWHIVGIKADVLPNGQVVYNSLWECSPSLHNYTYHDMGDAEYQMRLEENRARGYVLILEDHWQRPDGQMRHWAVWSQRPDGPMIEPDEYIPYYGPIPPLVEGRRYIRGGVVPPGPRGVSIGPRPIVRGGPGPVPPPPLRGGPRPPLRGPLPPPDEFAGGPPAGPGPRPVRFPPGFRG